MFSSPPTGMMMSSLTNLPAGTTLEPKAICTVSNASGTTYASWRAAPPIWTPCSEQQYACPGLKIVCVLVSAACGMPITAALDNTRLSLVSQDKTCSDVYVMSFPAVVWLSSCCCRPPDWKGFYLILSVWSMCWWQIEHAIGHPCQDILVRQHSDVLVFGPLCAVVLLFRAQDINNSRSWMCPAEHACAAELGQHMQSCKD